MSCQAGVHRKAGWRARSIFRRFIEMPVLCIVDFSFKDFGFADFSFKVFFNPCVRCEDNVSGSSPARFGD